MGGNKGLGVPSCEKVRKKEPVEKAACQTYGANGYARATCLDESLFLVLLLLDVMDLLVFRGAVRFLERIACRAARDLRAAGARWLDSPRREAVGLFRWKDVGVRRKGNDHLAVGSGWFVGHGRSWNEPSRNCWRFLLFFWAGGILGA
jgi:hypothetical protein